MARQTLASLRAENEALRSEIETLRFQLNQARAQRPMQRTPAGDAARLRAMNAARELAMRLGTTVKVGTV